MPSIIPLGATTSAPAFAVRDGDPTEDLERLVVQHGAVVVEEAAVPVIRVLAHAHVGHHDELGARVLERAYRLLHDTVVGVALRAQRVLRARDPEEEDGLDARARRARAPLPRDDRPRAGPPPASRPPACARPARRRRRAGRRGRRAQASSRERGREAQPFACSRRGRCAPGDSRSASSGSCRNPVTSSPRSATREHE